MAVEVTESRKLSASSRRELIRAGDEMCETGRKLLLENIYHKALRAGSILRGASLLYEAAGDSHGAKAAKALATRSGKVAERTLKLRIIEIGDFGI